VVFPSGSKPRPSFFPSGRSCLTRGDLIVLRITTNFRLAEMTLSLYAFL